MTRLKFIKKPQARKMHEPGEPKGYNTKQRAETREEQLWLEGHLGFYTGVGSQMMAPCRYAKHNPQVELLYHNKIKKLNTKTSSLSTGFLESRTKIKIF